MSKEVSIAELAQLLHRGETVFIPGSAAEPTEFTQFLCDQPDAASGVYFITSFIPGINSRNLVAGSGQRRMRTFFMQPALQADWAAGKIDFCPISYFGVQQYLDAPATRIDAVVVQVSEPDAEGRCSLGPSVEFLPSMLHRAARVYAIVNPRVPFLVGSIGVRLSDCTHFARSVAPLATYDAGAVNASSAQIATNIAEIIPNGASIQIGLGKVPSQLLLALRSHRNLGIHGGMLSDSIVKLAEAGALAPDQPMITGIIVGLESFYARAAAMADLQLAPVSHTHNPHVLAGVPRLHAVNSAIEVDLVGQVNAEMQSGKYVSGPGGGPDFAAAAHRQQDGLSIIALPATDSSGRVSRIVAQFAAGTPVAIPQHDVDVVVTEHGVAMLRGQDLDSRIQRLIAVAHPDHRSRLAQLSRR